MGVVSYPETDSPADIEAARVEMFSIKARNTSANPTEPINLWNNTWLADPVIFGRYPEDGLRAYGKAVPKFTESDMKTISQPIDFYGANIYNGASCRAGEDGQPVRVPRHTGFPLTAIKWPVTPECLYWGPKFLFERYGLPVVITENGLSSNDWVSRDGRCHDPQRIDFLDRYLRELGRAIQDGVDARGYFLWSIMDNFEWAEGYKERFGIVHVDFTTQVRTLKDSAYWYRDLIAGGRLPL